MSTKTSCAGKRKSGWHSYPCTNAGKHEHLGQMWCGLHHPPTVKAKEDAKQASWDAEWRARQANSAAVEAAAAEQARRAAYFDDLLAALQLIADAENSALDLAYCKGVARAAIAKTKEQT